MNEEYIKILDDVSSVAKERNEMLKDSQYGAFALSDEALQKDVIQTASQIFKEKQSKMWIREWNKAWKKFGQIKFR